MNLSQIKIGLLGFISLIISMMGQSQDTISVKDQFNVNYIVSGIVISAGVIVNKEATKRGFRDWVRRNHDVPATNIDDLLQHAPIAMLYLSDLALGYDKEAIGRHTRHLLVSQGLTLSTMFLAKGIFNNRRPSGGSRAFPSGHTAYAFASANAMYHSLKEDHPVLAYSGYIPAIITGSYRILKDKHWVSDVLVGAGMGILFSHLSYHLDFWHSRSIRYKSSSKRSSVSYKLGVSQNGIGMAVQF